MLWKDRDVRKGVNGRKREWSWGVFGQMDNGWPECVMFEGSLEG
jgi:hypothetical protein